jgi:hemerythrin superfamily protein
MANRMDTLVSKTRGVAKSVKARMDGLTGVFATLAKQHGEAASLLETVVANPEKRVDLWPQIRTALLAHERAEMHVLYPSLRLIPETQALAEHHDIEAHALEGMIEHLDTLPIESEMFGKLFVELADTVKNHATVEEEQEIFPIALRAIGETRAREIDVRYIAMHEKLMKQS